MEQKRGMYSITIGYRPTKRNHGRREWKGGVRYGDLQSLAGCRIRPLLCYCVVCFRPIDVPVINLPRPSCAQGSRSYMQHATKPDKWTTRELHQSLNCLFQTLRLITDLVRVAVLCFGLAIMLLASPLPQRGQKDRSNT